MPLSAHQGHQIRSVGPCRENAQVDAQQSAFLGYWRGGGEVPSGGAQEADSLRHSEAGSER